MNRKTTSRKEKDDILCADVDDGTVMEYVSVLKHGPGVTQEKRERSHGSLSLTWPCAGKRGQAVPA